MGLSTLKADCTQFLMIDMQEKLLPAISGQENILRNSVKILKGANILGIPVRYTEQYPRGLGNTVDRLSSLLTDHAARFEKTHFSCMDEPGFANLYGKDRKQIVIFGIESHICILSTVMDMLLKDFTVTVVADACGSRLRKNHLYAMDTMSRNGALIIPTESVIYQLIGEAGTPQFKQMLPLFKEKG